MEDSAVIEAISQEPVPVKLAAGEFKVHPLTVRRSSKLTVMLKVVQGDPNALKNPDTPEFYQAVTEMLASVGDQALPMLACLTGDNSLEKLEDISLLDVSAICVAAAKANKANVLLANFTRATDILSGPAGQK